MVTYRMMKFIGELPAQHH